MKRLAALIVLFLALPVAAATRFEDLSYEEKLGQTLVVFVDVDSASQVRPAIEAGKIGGVLIQWGNYSLKQTQQLVEKLQSWAAKSPHKIPLLISIDYEGGTVYTPITLGFDYLPTNMMLSAAQDEEGAAAIAYLAGLELRRAGVHINFSPVLDVNSNPHNPIIGVRSFGSDPANVTKMGLSLMNGFKAAGVISVVKHFPGHGDTSADSHYKVPVVKADYNELQKIHLAPFAEAVRQEVPGVMTGHVVYPALDGKNIATFSKPILHDLLREKMGFKGFVVTDSLDMKSATSFCTIAGCAVRALDSGADMILLGRYIKPLTVFKQILQETQQKKMQPRVEEAARRIFEWKEKLGLLDGTIQTPAPIEQAYQAALEKISNEFFAINVPDGWQKTISPTQANGALLVLVQNNKENIVVSVSITPVNMSARQLAEQTSQNMKAGGWTVSEPVQQGDSFTVDFKQEGKKLLGIHYFSSNGERGGVVTIMAPSIAQIAKGKLFVQENLKPADARLFPVKY